MTTESTSQASVQTLQADAWQELFSVTEDHRRNPERLLANLGVTRDDILTAKLGTTMKFYQAVENGDIAVLPGGLVDLGRVLDMFCLLAQFDNLARARYGELRKPAFWVRGEKGKRDRMPAIPVESAARLCGVSESVLRSGLVPVARDGAVEVIRSPSGIAAILVHPGYVNTLPYRGLLEA